MIIKKNDSLNHGLKIMKSFGDLIVSSDWKKVRLKDRKDKVIEHDSAKKSLDTQGSLLKIHRIGTQTSSSIETRKYKKSKSVIQKRKTFQEIQNSKVSEVIRPHKSIVPEQHIHYSKNSNIHNTVISNLDSNPLFLKGTNIHNKSTMINRINSLERKSIHFINLNINEVPSLYNHTKSYKINRFISDFINFANKNLSSNNQVKRMKQKSLLITNLSEESRMKRQILNLKSSDFLRTLNCLTINNKRRALSRSKIDFSKTLVCKNIKLFNNSKKLRSFNTNDRSKTKEKILKIVKFKIPNQIMLYKS